MSAPAASNRLTSSSVVCENSLVPETDGVERFRRRDADDLVGDSAQPLAGFTRADRHGHDDARRRLLAKRQNRRLHRRSGRQAVVDEDDGAIADDGSLPTAAIQHVATFQLEPLAHRHLLDQRMGNAEVANQILAEHFDATCGDRAHRELGMTRHAEFADEEDVQRRLQPRRHFARHRNTASWEGRAR